MRPRQKEAMRTQLIDCVSSDSVNKRKLEQQPCRHPERVSHPPPTVRHRRTAGRRGHDSAKQCRATTASERPALESFRPRDKARRFQGLRQQHDCQRQFFIIGRNTHPPTGRSPAAQKRMHTHPMWPSIKCSTQKPSGCRLTRIFSSRSAEMSTGPFHAPGTASSAGTAGANRTVVTMDKWPASRPEGCRVESACAQRRREARASAAPDAAPHQVMHVSVLIRHGELVAEQGARRGLLGERPALRPARAG
jgi:hypothetical protein